MSDTVAKQLTAEDLAKTRVFGLRVRDSILPAPRQLKPGERPDSNPPRFLLQSGDDVLIPLVASGHGLVQTSEWPAHFVFALVSGNFRVQPEMFSAYPAPDPGINAWKMSAERGRLILEGKHFIKSFAGCATMMALHPYGKWPGVGEDLGVPGTASGMFLDFDVRTGDHIPLEVEQAGFFLRDDEHHESPFKIPLCWELTPTPLETVAAGAAKRKSRYFVPKATPSQIRTALEWARSTKRDVSVGATTIGWNGDRRNAKKIHRLSDLPVVRSTPSHPELDEMRMLIDGTGFTTLAGLVIFLATMERPERKAVV